MQLHQVRPTMVSAHSIAVIQEFTSCAIKSMGQSNDLYIIQQNYRHLIHKLDDINRIRDYTLKSVTPIIFAFNFSAKLLLDELLKYREVIRKGFEYVYWESPIDQELELFTPIEQAFCQIIIDCFQMALCQGITEIGTRILIRKYINLKIKTTSTCYAERVNLDISMSHIDDPLAVENSYHKLLQELKGFRGSQIEFTNILKLLKKHKHDYTIIENELETFRKLITLSIIKYRFWPKVGQDEHHFHQATKIHFEHVLLHELIVKIGAGRLKNAEKITTVDRVTDVLGKVWSVVTKHQRGAIAFNVPHSE